MTAYKINFSLASKGNYEAMNLTSSDYLIKQMHNVYKMYILLSHMIV